MSNLKQSKLKLLVVTTTFPRWKNDTDPPFVYELAKRLTSKFDIIIHTPHYPGSREKERFDDVQVYRFRYFIQRWEKIAGQNAILPFLKKNKTYMLVLPFFLISQIISLTILVHRTRPDIIHAHWLVPCGFCAVFTKIFGRSIPIVVTCHGADVFGLRSSLFVWVKKWTLKRVNSVAAVSRIINKEVKKLGYDNSNIVTIPMGVDSTRFSPHNYSLPLSRKLNIKGIFLLFVGRLSEKKGVEYLLEAIRLLVDQNYNVTLVVVGDGELLNELKEKSQTLKLDHIVRFEGALPNNILPAYYATADIFIGPSIVSEGGDAEGFGLTFVEASMSGCFIIGTNTGGIVDIIKQGKTGLLARPQNSTDLAEKIKWVIDYQETAKNISEYSRSQQIKMFEWNTIARRYRNLLLSVLKNS